jgi:DNA helicase-2/ATP-dependent DNA helicase PcrA
MGDLLSVRQLYDSINEIPGRNITLSPNQKQIIEFGTGPLWIIAGPGSGKTECLVLRGQHIIRINLWMDIGKGMINVRRT